MVRGSLWVAIGLILTATVGVGAGPWLLYAVGLAMIDGRPPHASQTLVTLEDTEVLFRHLKLSQPFQLDPHRIRMRIR
jgi:hypothetical protein